MKILDNAKLYASSSMHILYKITVSLSLNK
jgi:hypothetical protein